MSVKRTAKSFRRSAGPLQGRANLAKLRRVTEAELQRSSPLELRELPSDFWEGAVPVLPAAKVPISLRVDSDVLEFFREAGPRYQSRMNAVLRSYMERTTAMPKRSK
ncbi:MAG: BrnA antitoxin family protein [Gemmatimonadaceae bacterium]|nr:BrnA antitoxin family protein [Gemmatimonadaceae bacterium]